MVSWLLHPLLDQGGLVVYAIVGALVFAEAGILIGFVFPGETAVLLGGVIAGRHHVSLPVLIVVVVVCAVVGDSVGYWVGRRFGPRLLRIKVLATRQWTIEATQRFLRRRGGWAVFLARFTAFLRAMVPGLAGMSDMPYRIFLPANALGGLLWGTGFCVLGFVLGKAYTRVQTYSDWVSYAAIALVVLVFVVASRRAKRRERRMLAEELGAADAPGAEAGR